MGKLDPICLAIFDNCSVTWPAFEALGGFAAAIAGGAAAIAAVRAAKIALQIEQNAANRIADREKRDGLPLAVALARELMFTRSIVSAVQRGPWGSESEDNFLLRIAGYGELLKVPILRNSLLSLGCFDIPTGTALALALADVTKLESELPSPDLLPLIAQLVLVPIRNTADTTEKSVISAIVALERYAGEAVLA